jgi:hypothetical protein
VLFTIRINRSGWWLRVRRLLVLEHMHVRS